MADADWTNYVGAVTGVVALVVSVITYRRSNQIKALDLRIELRKALGEAHASVSTARTLMDSAGAPRRSLFADAGRGGSGTLTAREQAFIADRAELDRIAASIRSEAADFTAISTEQLETEIIATHKIKTDLSILISKYRDMIAEVEAARARSAARGAGFLGRR